MMKRTFLTFSICCVISLCCTFSIIANKNLYTKIAEDGTLTTVSRLYEQSLAVQTSKEMKAAQAQEDEEQSYTITVKAKNVPNYRAQQVVVLSNYPLAAYEEHFYGEESVELSVPQGTYDLIVSFDKLEDEWTMECLAYVIKTDMGIDGDMEITIDPSEAARYYSFSSFNSKGELLKVPKYKVSDNPDDPYVLDMELLEEGNVTDLTMKTVLCNTKLGPITINTSMVDCDTEGVVKQSAIKLSNIYVNDAEGYYFMQQRAYQMEDTSNDVVFLIPENCNETDISNAGIEFTDVDIAEIDKIKAASETEHQTTAGSFPGLEVRLDGTAIAAQDFIVPGLLNPGKDQINCNRLRFSLPKLPNVSRSLRCGITQRSTDMMIRYDVDTIWWDEESYTVINRSRESYDFGRKINLDDKGEINMDGQLLSGFLSLNSRTASSVSIPMHPFFPDYDEMEGKTYNTTQPYFTGLFSADTTPSYHAFTYLDNLGGKISTYEYASDWTFNQDGKQVLSSEDYPDLLDRYTALGKTLDNCLPEMLNELNIKTFNGKIENLDSFTDCTVKFGGNESDATAPVLQIMSFIDENGNFANKFASPKDGMIQMTCGDFKIENAGINNTEAFVCKSEKLVPQIEYSLYSKNEWNSLTPQEVNIDADDCYGDSWRISLESIVAPEDLTAYDLRIKLTDKAGNSIIQTISPAFLIDKNCSIDKVFENNEIMPSLSDEEIEIYNLEGNRVSETNLVRGIYFVRTKNNIRKIII